MLTEQPFVVRSGLQLCAQYTLALFLAGPPADLCAASTISGDNTCTCHLSLTYSCTDTCTPLCCVYMCEFLALMAQDWHDSESWLTMVHFVVLANQHSEILIMSCIDANAGTITLWSPSWHMLQQLQSTSTTMKPQTWLYTCRVPCSSCLMPTRQSLAAAALYLHHLSSAPAAATTCS